MSWFEANSTLDNGLNSTLRESNLITTPGTPTTNPSEDQTLRNILIISCYALIVVVSLCGNLLVCKIAFTKKKMRTTTNMLIACLAFSDIVMTCFNIPINIARILLLNWPFGSFLCFFAPFIQISCVYVSTFTMAVISLHRWRTITRRSTFRSFSPLKLFFIILVIWLLAMVFSLPVSIFQRIEKTNLYGQVVTRCRAKFPDVGFNYNLFLSVEILLTQYVIPLTITCVVYIKIGCIVYAQGKLAGQSNDRCKRRQIEAKRRGIMMLALVVIVFAICCYNPFIYCYYNASYRSMVKESLGCVFRCLKCHKVQTHGEANSSDEADEQTTSECTKYTVCANTERIEMLDKTKIIVQVNRDDK